MPPWLQGSAALDQPGWVQSLYRLQRLIEAVRFLLSSRRNKSRIVYLTALIIITALCMKKLLSAHSQFSMAGSVIVASPQNKL